MFQIFVRGISFSANEGDVASQFGNVTREERAFEERSLLESSIDADGCLKTCRKPARSAGQHATRCRMPQDGDRHRGYAFLECDPADPERIIRGINSTPHMGRTLHAEPARPPAQRPEHRTAPAPRGYT